MFSLITHLANVLPYLIVLMSVSFTLRKLLVVSLMKSFLTLPMMIPDMGTTLMRMALLG